MKEKGKKFIDISKDLKVPISKVMNLYYYKPKAQKCKPGPKSKITKRESLRIKRYIQNCNDNGIRVACNNIVNSLDLPVGRRNVNKYLLQRELRSVKVPQVISLTKAQREKRIKFASRYLAEDLVWEHCVFSDEKKFNLDGPDNC